jgi:hypothetical protein
MKRPILEPPRPYGSLRVADRRRRKTSLKWELFILLPVIGCIAVWTYFFSFFFRVGGAG